MKTNKSLEKSNAENYSLYLSKRFNYRCQHCGTYIYLEGINGNIFKISTDECEHIFIKCSILDSD